MQVPGLEDRLGPVRLVLSGSAPLDPDLTASFTARTHVEVHQGYGLTEAAPVVTSTLCSKVVNPRSVGAALPGIEIRLVDEDGRAPKDEDGGEIHLRGDNLFSGYWPDGDGGPGPDGWFSTSDIGYLSDGELFLVDRSRDLVIVNGFNVYPAEVEQVIADLPGVTEVAVVGQPDARTGEQVVAFVVGPVSVDEIDAHCQTQLAKFKRPSDIRVVSELPRGATGKILTGALRQSLGAQEQAP